MNSLFRRFAGLALLAAALPAFAQQAPTETALTPEIKADLLADIRRLVGTAAFVPGADFGQLEAMLEARAEALENASDDAEFVSIINSALGEFGFSHIVLYTPRYADMRQNRRMVGLGVRIEIEAEGIRVVSVFPGSAASETDIQSGDLITEADGKPVRGPEDLRGEEGSKVTVTILRDGDTLKRELTRRSFSTVIPESISWPDERTAVVAIPTFDVGYSGENIRGLMQEAMKADRIIVDLRGNGGGQVINLLNFAGYFLTPEEPLGTFIGREMVANFEEETGKDGSDLKAVADWAKTKVRAVNPGVEKFEGQVAVLVDAGTGSASEMMAAALREHRGAFLVGSQTAGAVLASLMRPISHGFLLQYPVTDYVTIEGLRLEGNGLAPDEEAATPRFGEPDEGVAAAVRWFEQSAGR